MSKYRREWRRRKALESIKKRCDKYIEAYKQAKSRNHSSSTEKIAYVAGIIDGEGSIFLGTQRHGRLLCPGIHISNDDEKMIRFCKEVLECGWVVERKPSRTRLKKSWALGLAGKEKIVKTLIMIRPFLITKQKQADLLFEFCSNKLELRRLYIDRDYEIYRALKKLNSKKKANSIVPSIEQLKQQIHYSYQKFKGD